jgi:hypothetical protein
LQLHHCQAAKNQQTKKPRAIPRLCMKSQLNSDYSDNNRKSRHSFPRDLLIAKFCCTHIWSSKLSYVLIDCTSQSLIVTTHTHTHTQTHRYIHNRKIIPQSFEDNMTVGAVITYWELLTRCQIIYRNMLSSVTMPFASKTTTRDMCHRNYSMVQQAHGWDWQESTLSSLQAHGWDQQDSTLSGL